MPDLRIQSSHVGLTINNGRVDASKLTAAQAEKLLAQVGATMISANGSPRSGYLRMRVENDGILRFTASHWSRSEKAAAAQLMLDLAAKAWGGDSVDTQALDRYLRAPDNRPNQLVAEGSRQLGTKSLLKLLASRHDSYNTADTLHIKNAEGQTVRREGANPLIEARSEASVSRLQAYANRFLKEGGRPGGRLQVDGGPARTKEIQSLAAAVAPAKAASAQGPRSVEAARILAQEAVNKRHGQILAAYAQAKGVELTPENRDQLDKKRLAATKLVQSKILEQQVPEEIYFRRGGTTLDFSHAYHSQTHEYLGGSKRQDMATFAAAVGLKGIDDWTFAKPKDVVEGPVNSPSTKVLLDGYADDIGRAYTGPKIDQVQTALRELQAGYQKNIFMPPHDIEALMKQFQQSIGEPSPDPSKPDVAYRNSGIASIAFEKITGFCRKFRSISISTETVNSRPTPLDYALMGIKGVNGLNFGPINDILLQMPKGSMNKDADPHPALVIQQVVDTFNEKVMSPFVKRYYWDGKLLLKL